MNTTVKGLQAVYVKIGGSLTDTYDGIADGAPVGGYSLITDVLKAIFVKCGGSLSTVYSDIAPDAVGGYSKNADVVGAIGKVVKLYVAPVLESATVNPSTTQQTITPEQGVDGFNSITATPVTAAIDANITAGNIKKDVEILGVTGSYEGGVSNYSFIGRGTVEGYQAQVGISRITELVLNNIGEFNSIAESAFENCEYLENLVIPSSYTSILGRAFSGCVRLRSLTLPSNLDVIQYGAFQRCSSLASLKIPSSVTFIGDEAFLNHHSLGTVDLTEFDGTSVPTIGNDAFASDNPSADFKFVFATQSALDAFAADSGWTVYSQYFEVAQS